MGKVRTQAVMMLPAIPQRTAEKRWVEPTPITEAVTQWVVLTGMPSCEAVSMTEAAAK